MAEEYPGRTVTRDGDSVVIRVPVRFYRRNGRQMVCSGESQTNDRNPVVLALAKAFLWQEEYESGKYTSLEDLAQSKGVDRTYAGRIIRLNSLAPRIVESILNNRGPANLSLAQLHRGIPLNWVDRPN